MSNPTGINQYTSGGGHGIGGGSERRKNVKRKIGVSKMINAAMVAASAPSRTAPKHHEVF